MLQWPDVALPGKHGAHKVNANWYTSNEKYNKQKTTIINIFTVQYFEQNILNYKLKLFRFHLSYLMKAFIIWFILSLFYLKYHSFGSVTMMRGCICPGVGGLGHHWNGIDRLRSLEVGGKGINAVLGTRGCTCACLEERYGGWNGKGSERTDLLGDLGYAWTLWWECDAALVQFGRNGISLATGMRRCTQLGSDGRDDGCSENESMNSQEDER